MATTNGDPDIWNSQPYSSLFYGTREVVRLNSMHHGTNGVAHSNSIHSQPLPLSQQQQPVEQSYHPGPHQMWPDSTGTLSQTGLPSQPYYHPVACGSDVIPPYQSGDPQMFPFGESSTQIEPHVAELTMGKIRATKACEPCRQRKRKCGESTPCSGCVEDKLDCHYRETRASRLDAECVGRLDKVVDLLRAMDEKLDRLLGSSSPGLDSEMDADERV